MKRVIRKAMSAKKNLTLTKENLDWVVTTGYTIVSQTFLLKSKQWSGDTKVCFGSKSHISLETLFIILKGCQD